MSTLTENVTKVKNAHAALKTAIEAKGVSVPAGTKLTGMPALVDQIQTGGGQDYGYLTFTSVEASTLTLMQQGSIEPLSLLKSTDAQNWTKWENPSTNGIQLQAGESVYIKADEDASYKTTNGYYYNYFATDGKMTCVGDVRSLIRFIPGDYSQWFEHLFYNCSGLTATPELSETNLVKACYNSMFQNCTSLTNAPSLPANVVANQCYQHMFSGCSSLTAAPELPASTLAEYCYNSMFAGCKSLTAAPQLPATTLVKDCYSLMFDDCTSLTNVPAFQATTLAKACYSSTFRNCTSLVNAPALPATTLAEQCYYNMFAGCTSLTAAPQLPATTLAWSCYLFMFSGCTSLTAAPQLPATTLAQTCYYNMFQNCTSLEQAPNLPATTMDTYCYDSMFYGCSALKRIKMNASSGGWGTNMFNGCAALELVDMTGSTDVPTLEDVNNFENTNDTYKVVVPDSLYDTWIAATNWASIASHIMKQSDWNAAHTNDQL